MAYKRRVNIKSMLGSNFSLFFLPAIKQSKHGRAMGGIAVFVKQSLSNSVSRINKDNTVSVQLKFDTQSWIARKPKIFVFTYLPPVNSPFYQNCNLKGFELLKESVIDLINSSTIELFIVGDLNSRTGEQNDFIDSEVNVPEYLDCTDILNDYTVPPRTSKNKEKKQIWTRPIKIL